jgi:hypothetical protein
MTLGYIAPLQRAWQRMTALLFQPVQPGVWLLLGVAAFLGGEQYWKASFGARLPGREEIDEWRDMLQDPMFLGFVIVFGTLGLILGLLFAWIFSRGAFVFLDDVLHCRTDIAEPWTRFRRQGNSLFLWVLGFGLVSLLVWTAALWRFASTLWSLESGTLPWSLVVPMIAVAVMVGLVMAFVQMLTYHFVVPLMWAHGLTVLQAWSRFLPVLFARPGAFILYGLFVLALTMLAVVAVIGFGLGTLCLGFCALAIPVIGAAVLLPISIPWRALGPEFLSQLGPEVFPPLPPPRPIDPDAGRPMPVIAPQAPAPWGGPGTPPESPA